METKGIKRVKQLTSEKAFGEFIKQRKNYKPPEFLRKTLHIDCNCSEQNLSQCCSACPPARRMAVYCDLLL